MPLLFYTICVITILFTKLADPEYHDLRHTAGSMLLQKGIDIKTIQHFLGHSQASTTVNIYLHSISNGTVDAANAIGSMVNVGTAC